MLGLRYASLCWDYYQSLYTVAPVSFQELIKVTQNFSDAEQAVLYIQARPRLLVFVVCCLSTRIYYYTLFCSHPLNLIYVANQSAIMQPCVERGGRQQPVG